MMLSIQARGNVARDPKTGRTHSATPQLAGLIPGYSLLISAGVFLVYVLYQAIRAQLFDTFVAGMVAVVAGYCLVGTLMVVVAHRRWMANRLR